MRADTRELPARPTWRSSGTPLGSLAVAVGVLAALAGPAAAGAPARDDLAGTYRIQGTARVDAAAPLGRQIASRGDAIVRTAGGGGVRLRLASMGQACELTASRAADGALSFAAGQHCLFDLRDPGARGHVEARLRAGRGRLRDRHLAVDLAFDLSGVVSLRTSEAVQMLGVEIPASWTPDLPVDGGASVQAEGDRDESRAVEQG